MRRAQGGTQTGGNKPTVAGRRTKVVVRDGNDPSSESQKGGAVARGPKDDKAIAVFLQEAKQEVKSTHVIRKVSGYQDVIRLGPEFVDDDYKECTPVPLWQKAQPIINFDMFLDRTDDDIIQNPQTISALFELQPDHSPELNWDPNLTDLEEDCFYQDLLHWPSKKLTHSRPYESKKEPIVKKRVKVFKPSGDYIIKTRLTIDLTETVTVMLFEIAGNMILQTDAKFESVKVSNERYGEMVKDHIVSDTYANDYAQCFDDYSLSKYTDYKIRGCSDIGTEIHAYSIVDEYIQVADEDARRKVLEQDEAALRIIAGKTGWKDSDPDDSGEEILAAQDLDFRADISKYKEDDEGNYRNMIMDEASDDDIAMTDGDEEEFEIKQSLDVYYKNKKLKESKRPPRDYPDISFSLIAMERIICMDSQQMRQADMRGLIEPEPPKKPFGLSALKSEDEDDTKGGDGEMDEDEMVSLLIQQHRMQEQLEKGGSIDEGMPTIIIPDAQDVDADRKEEDEDDDLLQEANAAEEAERKRQEQLKVEQEAAAAAAAAEKPDEKDEFDLAVEELQVAAKGGENVPGKFAEQQSTIAPQTAVTDQQQSEITGEAGVTASGPTATALDVSSIVDTAVPLSGSQEEQVTPPTVTESKIGPEVKTIVPAPAQGIRPATAGIASVAPSQGALFGMAASSDLKCSWTETDEKIDEAKRLEEELAAGVPDVIDDEPLDLAQFNVEEGLSEDEDDLRGNQKQKKDLTDMMEEREEEGEQEGEPEVNKSGAPAAVSTDEQNKDNAVKRPSDADVDGQKNEEKKVVEEDEFDDISSDETHHENSVLSDHVELSEDASTDSDISQSHPVLDSRRQSESGGNMYSDYQVDDGPSQMTQGPHLRQYWTFKCTEAQGMEVTDITHHPLNENIIAASYGSVRFGDHERDGLVCIWNAKNNRSPERIYKLRAPGTSLAFSTLTPFVLAVGMLDGNVVLFDIREDDAMILGSTVDQTTFYGHLGPVWQVYFLIEVDASNEDMEIESMLTLGDDGLLKKWTVRKGLESIVLMKVGRSTMQVPGRREKRSESLITSLSIAYTICFLPNHSDLFLLGTEEGFIHKGSTAYKESYLNTYVGHTGPVYRVAFSNFDETVFFSCGGDWTVKMWKLDHPVPLLSLQTAHRTIFDVTCSCFLSTVFICATEYHVEVWDLSVNTLEPAVQFDPLFSEGQRKIAFNGILNSVIIGDEEGFLSIYGLRNFPKPPPTKDAQRELLLESLLPGYKRKKEAEEAERQRKREMEQARHSETN